MIGKCLEKGVVIENRLTVFHDTGHAFVRLECSDCSKGKPVSMYVGFYPPGAEDPGSSLSPRLKLYALSDLADDSPPMLNLGALGAKGLGKKLPKLSGVGGLKIMSNKLAEVSSLVYVLNGVSEGGYSINIEAPSFVDGPSVFSAKLSASGYSSSYLRDMKQQSFNISAAGARSVLDRVLHVTDNCDRDLRYKPFSSNCIDFAQDLYARSGLEGDHLDVMHPRGYPNTQIGYYKFLSEVRSGKTNTGVVVQILLATVMIVMIARLGSYVMSLTKTKEKEVKTPAASSAKKLTAKDVASKLGLDSAKKPSMSGKFSTPVKTPTHTKGRRGRGFC